MRHFILGLGVALISSCTSTPLPSPSSFVTYTSDRKAIVYNDLGGDLIERVKYLPRLRTMREVALVGFCHSACTIYLELEHVCTYEDTIFVFHGPSHTNSRPLTDSHFVEVSRAIAAYYPSPLSSWYTDQLTANHGTDLFIVMGATLIDLDYIKQCPD